MKITKSLAVLLALVLLVPMLFVPANALEPLGHNVTLSHSAVDAGQEFEVLVSLTGYTAQAAANDPIRGLQIDIQGIDQELLDVVSYESLIPADGAASNTASYNAATKIARLLYVKTSGTLAAPCENVFRVVFRLQEDVTSHGILTLPMTVKIQTASKQITQTSQITLDYGIHQGITSLEISALPEKLSYFGKKEALDLTGGMITIHYDNETTLQLPMTEEMVSGFDNTVPGPQTLTVFFSGKTATFQVEITTATVTFLNADGTLLSSAQYLYGETVQPPATPTKAADHTYTYTFAGWNTPVVPCTGDATYTATFTPTYIDYTITFQHQDGTVIRQITAHYGDSVTAPGTPALPQGLPGCYDFQGWDKTVTSCTGNAVYTALFRQEHKMGAWGVAQEPTCTAEGRQRRDCNFCDYYETNPIPTLEHSYSAVVTPPTCTADGYTTHTCSGCGHHYTDTPVTTPGHNWNPATCTVPKTCRICGTTEGAALSHSYSNGSCTNCGAEDPDYVPPTEPTEPEPTEPAPTDPEPTEPEPTEPEPTEPEPTDPEPTEPEPTEPEPTEPEPTEPEPTEPEPTDPAPTDPEPTEPEPTEPEPTEPEPTEPEPTEPEPTEPVEPELDGVVRLAGANRYATGYSIANQLKEVLGVDKFQAVVVAYGQNFPDALTGSYLAAVKNAPILLTEAGVDHDVLAYLRENLVSGGQVYILGGTAAVSQNFEDNARAAGFNVKRLKGAGRYETNLAILLEAGVNTTDEILIATGKNYADSLSASATGLPMLLVDKNLTDSQKAFLAGTSKRFVILGGTGAVSAEIEAELAAMGTVVRVKGASRYGTSVEIAKRYFTNPSAAVLAYAEGFPDGLCGGPLALALGAPLILTSDKSSAMADEYVVGITSGAVTGGTARISDDTVRNIFDLPANTPVPKK